MTGGQIQNESTHHVKYQASNLCRGSSGGGVYVKPSTSVLGLHTEAITDADFDTDDNDNKTHITETYKRVSSKDYP